MRDRLSYLAVAVGGGVVAVALTFALRALAGDGDATTDDVPRTMVYQGYLERDGVAVNEPQILQFRIYTSEAVDGGTGVLLYTETENNVPVYRGRFSVVLGDGPDATSPTATLEQVIGYADDLQLEIAVLTSGTPVVLTGRQPLSPAPFAVWAARSTNMTVANELTASTATVTTLAADTATVTDLGATTVNADTVNFATTTFPDPGNPGTRLPFKGMQYSPEVTARLSVNSTSTPGTVSKSAPAGYERPDRAVCFLTRHQTSRTQNASYALRTNDWCDVYLEGTTWTLRASARPPDSGDVWSNATIECKMRCVRWNW